MATVMCISDDGNRATFIGTFLESGDNVRLCDECMPNFCAAVFERMTGVDMTPALYLASQEGQTNPDGPAGHPEQVAYPPDMEPQGNPDPQGPASAPADPEPQDAGDPTSGDSGTGGGQEPVSQSSSAPADRQTGDPPDIETEPAAAGQ